MNAIETDTIAKITGHCRIFHAHSKAGPSPHASASLVASVGPVRINANETRMNRETATVRPMAINRTFHHGRLSSMPYARFSVSMMAVIAADELDTASSIPRL